MSQDGGSSLDARAYERLSAYLDGEASAEERRRIEAQLECEPDLARALDEMRALATDLERAYPLSDAAPVAAPPRPRADGRRAAARRRPPSRRGRIPLAAFAAAAAATLAIGFGVGSWRTQETIGRGGVSAGVVAASSPLSRVLETARVGDAVPSDDGALVILGTFLTAEGAPCREFEKLLDGAPDLTFGVACRSERAEWRVLFAATAPKQAAPDGRITPASGPALDAMDRLLDGLGAGPMLSAEDEGRLLSNGWRPDA